MSNEAKCLNHCGHKGFMVDGVCLYGETSDLRGCRHVCTPMTDSEESMEVPELLPCPFETYHLFQDKPYERYVAWGNTGFRVHFSRCGTTTPAFADKATAETCWNTRVSQAQGSERVAAEIVRSFKYSNRGDGMEDADPHSDDNPDYIRAAIDERLEECAVALAASPSLSGAPGELKEVQECDKCDLCEDHHE